MIDSFNNVFESWGLNPTWASIVVKLGLLTLTALVAWLANLVTRHVILEGIKALVTRTRNTWDDAFLNSRLFDRLAHVAPALVFYLAAPVILPDDPLPRDLLLRLSLAWVALVGIRVAGAFLDAVGDIYETFEVSHQRPIRSYLQILKILAWIVGGILLIATLINRSPVMLLSGLGAMTAILLLVFKDTILGFVASIQLTANDMVRRGDWIEMPKFGADGDVIDVTVNTVKVQNWDKTITTIPTYALVSNDFKNWRGMAESDGRRICRSLAIDMTSIRFLDEAERKRLETSHVLGDYIRDKQKEIEEHNQQLGVDEDDNLNGRRQTNIGAFRAYLVRYLKAHPDINQEMTLLVRQLAPSAEGLPIQVYVFSSDKVWAHYEDIMSDIFDHILAVLPRFGLRPFQSPTGHDWRAGQNQREA